MYELSIETVFSAAHAIRIKGQPEPLHGHDWHVTATVGGQELDADGLVVDFHTVHEALEQIVAPFRSRNLNEVPPFDRVNPTAELVARHIADRLGAMMPEEARVLSVRVTEAPGCAATWRG